MSRTFETIKLDVEGGVATITLARPERMNAINATMTLELISALDIVDKDDEVRAIILTGEGEKAFCAGADISGGAATFDYAKRDPGIRAEAERGGTYRDSGGRVALRIYNSLKPVIGAINGAAVGAGATIPLACDIRLASDTARFGFPFVRRGIVPESASSWFLPRIVGISTALEWVLSGRLISAAEARERRLVRSVHSPADLLPAARELATEIVANAAPVSVALTRQMLWRMQGSPHPMEAHRLDSRLVQALGASDDAREGINAFLEKRSPHFRQRVSTDLPEGFPWWTEEQF
ncbi:enoyl-CoA hydratase [Tardibacter chloracetimidivorans]|uniref:Enoyl-CoA hydratase n=1 Tax=Tardibacter chloracetimidivorans TaxID=1921510 RepID=A0A1L3ZUT9_9SPHN|nr:crotonase/enoyl-CoA hydratase family protein [Tardibacter chloracetimidivorans]API59402.1 enoyl-CoA hydratase [Tardibacter chloracetimidivorans]